MADAAAAADVLLRSFAAALPRVRRAHGDDETRTWFREVVLPTQETWVALVGDEVVAVLVVHGGHVEQLYVAPDRVGRGIGSALLDLAKQRSPAGLRFFTFEVNDRARRFYERHGFQALAFSDGAANEEGEPDVLYGWGGGRPPELANGAPSDGCLLDSDR